MDYFLSIVIPVYNEEKRICHTLKKIIDYVESQNFSFELMLVDDGSQDKTMNVIENFSHSFSHQKRNKIKILNNNKNSGKGFSVKKGVLSSRGKYILFTDADLSTPIEELKKLLHYMKEGYNIAIGSRDLPDSKIIKHQNIFRESMGKFFNFLVRRFFNLKYKDTQCGFKIFDKDSAFKIFPVLKINDFSFDVEILYVADKLNLKVKEVPIIWKNSNDSKVRVFRDSLSMLINLIRIKQFHSSL